MKRRNFLLTAGGAILSKGLDNPIEAGNTTKSIGSQSDFIVVGAGIFGLWTAYYLQNAGAQVTLIDAYGPGNSRSSSGGESRILRSDYGERMIYTRMNIRAHELWNSWQEE